MSGRQDREGAPESYGSATPFRPAKTDPLLQRAIPVAKELPGYRTPTARRDVLAGVTVAVLSGTLESDGIAPHFARAKHPIADRAAERVTAPASTAPSARP